MKKIYNYIDEYFFGIVFFIVLIGLIGLIIIGEWQFAKSDLFAEEKECYSYYKENGFILDVCERYEEKFLKLERE